jgi:hypothetical protein
MITGSVLLLYLASVVVIVSGAAHVKTFIVSRLFPARQQIL